MAWVHGNLADEILRGYPVISNRVQIVIDCFREFGVAQAKWFDYKPFDPSLDGMNGVGSGSYVADSAIPVFAACILGFDPGDVGDIASRCQIDILRIHEYFDFKNPGIVFSASGVEDVDGVEFTKRFARGIAAAYSSHRNFVPAMQKLMSQRMIFALGVMDLGVEGLNMRANLDADIEFLRGYSEPGFIDFENAGFGESLSGMFDSISKLEHLPGGSPQKFLERSGALHPIIIRKSFGQGFWESMMYRKPDSHHLVFDTILRELIEQHPAQASQILMSLDFDTLNQESDAGLSTWTMDFLDHLLAKAGLQSTTNDVSYKIGFLTSALPRGAGLPLGSGASEVEEKLGNAQLASYFKELETMGPRLFERVMDSHLEIEPEHINRSHFRVWDFLQGLHPVAQKVSPGKLGLYLGHMAKAATTLFPVNHGKLELYAPFMVDRVTEEMKLLIRESGGEIDYSSLRGLDEDAKANLSDWGLGLRQLGVKSEKTIEGRMGADLGL